MAHDRTTVFTAALPAALPLCHRLHIDLCRTDGMCCQP